MRGLLVLVLVVLSEGLHHNGKRTFSGRMSPALGRLRESMNKKMTQLRNFVSGGDEPSSQVTTTTPIPSSTHTTIKGDGIDIGQLL